MKIHDFTSAPPKVQISGNRFGRGCRLHIAEPSLKAIAEGRLVVKVAGMGNRTIEDVEIRIECSDGQLNIMLGNSGSHLSFGAESRGNFNVVVWRASNLSIGAKTTSNGTKIYADDSDIEIAEDCMFSDSILIQGSDQHAIIDIPSRQIINRHRRRISIGRHVWLGRGSTVMPDVRIGDGSIVGTASLVSNDVPAFVVAAGVPARVVRTDTTWARNPESIDPSTRRLLEEL